MPLRRSALLWFLLALFVYNANGRSLWTGDSLPARYQAFGVLTHQTLLLEPWLRYLRDPFPQPYWVQKTVDGRAGSLYPVVTPIVVAPLYVPARLYLRAVAWRPAAVEHVAFLMEKLAASVLAALTVAFVWLTLKRLDSPYAALLTVACAFGTSLWTINSQALWQHSVSTLGMVVAVWAITGPARWSSILLTGGALGVALANRPADLPLVAALLMAALPWAGRRSVAMLFVAGLPMATEMLYFLQVYGHPFGGYGVARVASLNFFRGERLEGVAALLVSPANGMLVFAPFLAWIVRAPAIPGHRRVTIWILIGVALQLLLYSGTEWIAGACYGPRFMAESMPLLVILLARVRPTIWFAAAVAWALAAQFVGAFCYRGISTMVFYAGGAPHHDQAWRLVNFPMFLEIGEFAAMPFFDPAWWSW